MRRIVTFLMLVPCLVRVAAAAEQPAAGKFLVATEGVHGAIFDHAVILLLHYDENGAMGLVVNRPTEVAPGELMTDAAALSNYHGTLFWGGPVELTGLRALLRSPTPPDESMPVVDDVCLVPFDETLADGPMDEDRLRFFIGYTGWAPGQLDHELAEGSWDVVRATGDLVFADDPSAVWHRLAPAREYRAGIVTGDTGRLLSAL